jgi:hypothetical protein
MHLILSSRHPRNCLYSTEAGQILYKVDKPRSTHSNVATIRKAVNTLNGVGKGSFNIQDKSPPADEDHIIRKKEETAKDHHRRSIDSHDAPFADSEDEVEEGSRPSLSGLHVMEGHFAFYAQVEFHTFSSTRFRYNSLDMPVSEYFRKEGSSWFGRWV